MLIISSHHSSVDTCSRRKLQGPLMRVLYFFQQCRHLHNPHESPKKALHCLNNDNNTCRTEKLSKLMNHSMEKCQKPNIHLCNIILVIVETIFGSSEDFCLLYIYYLRKLVNIGKVKKKIFFVL